MLNPRTTGWANNLGSAKNTSALRNYLTKRGEVPESCGFKLMAFGPILPEATDRETHNQRRDKIAAAEKRLAEDLSDAGYEVMNPVHCRRALDESLYGSIRCAFAEHFPALTT